MDYTKSEKVEGESIKIIKSCMTTLAATGFNIDNKTDNSLECSANMIYNTKQNPLLGSSKIYINHFDNNLTLKADFGNVRKLLKFLSIFLFFLATGLYLLFKYALPHNEDADLSIIIISSIGPWIILIPLMYFIFKSRLTKALDSLLNNIKFINQ